MSIYAKNIESDNIRSLANIINEQHSQIENLTNTISSKNIREFDQTTKQNVIISYDETNNRYRFEIQKPENDIHVYQIWKKDSTLLNNQRYYYFTSLSKWIDLFKNAQKDNFKPTTIIRMNGNYYPTVLVNADYEIKDNISYCVFYFENNTINPSREVVMQIMPKNGSYNNVRIDIDPSYSPPMPKYTWGVYADNNYNKFYLGTGGFSLNLKQGLFSWPQCPSTRDPCYIPDEILVLERGVLYKLDTDTYNINRCDAGGDIINGYPTYKLIERFY